MTITELLEKYERVYFSILPDDKPKFLQLLRTEGFTWLNGSEIKVTDECNGHMSVRRDKKIASVAWFVWFRRDDIPKLDFEEFLKGNIVKSEDKFVAAVIGQSDIIQ